jgi:O-antigen/teichoic acid export membrane protein
MGEIKKQSLQGSFWAYLGAAFGIISQGFIIPNYFTTEQNGLLALLLSWTYIICQVASLGFNNAGTRYFPFFRDKQKNHKGYLNYSFWFHLAGTVLVLGFFLLADKKWLFGIANNDNNLFEKYYLYLIPLVVATMVFNVFDNYAKGLYSTVAGTLYSQFLQRFLLFVAILIYALKLLDFDNFLILWIVAFSFPTVLMFIEAYRLGGFSLVYSAELVESRQLKPFVVFALISSFSGLSSMILAQLDKIMINYYLGLSQTGIYNTCLLFASLMGLAYVAMNKAASSLVIDAMERKDFDQVETVLKKSSVNLFIFGCGILLLTWVSIDELFYFLKPEYTLGKTALLIIGCGKLFDLFNGVNALILINSRYYKLDTIIMVSFIVILFLLNALLIPAFGINGGAWATFFSLIYYNSVRSYFIYQKFGIHAFSRSQAVILVIFILCLFAGIQLPQFVNVYFSVFYKSVLIGSVFLFLMYKQRVSPELTSIIHSTLRKFKLL